MQSFVFVVNVPSQSAEGVNPKRHAIQSLIQQLSGLSVATDVVVDGIKVYDLPDDVIEFEVTLNATKRVVSAEPSQ